MSYMILARNYIFLKNYVTSEVVVSQNAVYYQQISVARYKVSFLPVYILSNYQPYTVPLTDTLGIISTLSII